jgi:hypothetical protein
MSSSALDEMGYRGYGVYPGKNPASKKPSRARHIVSICQLLQKPWPIITAPHERAMKASQLALPTLRSTMLLGSSNRKYVGKNMTSAMV